MSFKMLLSAALILCGIYFSFLGILYIFQRKLMYFPFPSSAKSMQSFIEEGGEFITLKTSDSLSLQAWFYAPKKDNKPVVVFFHGNASRHEWGWQKLNVFAAKGYGVLLASYRGYENNPGKPSEENLYLDARATIEWLQKKNYAYVLYGESLGTGISVKMAGEYSPLAVILESPYSSILEVAKRTYRVFPLRFLMKDQYHSIRYINQVHVPLLILHGKKDRLIPIEMAKKLFDAANEPKTFIVLEHANHNNMMEFGAQNKALEFISTVLEEN